MRFAPKKIKKIAIVESLETIDQLREIACILGPKRPFASVDLSDLKPVNHSKGK
jgi:hypothetical protein